jgi:hypothetical protein
MPDAGTPRPAPVRPLSPSGRPTGEAVPVPVTFLPAAELHRGDDLLVHPDPLRPESCACCHVLAARVHDGVVDVALRGHRVRALTLPAGLLVEVLEHAGPAAPSGAA